MPYLETENCFRLVGMPGLEKCLLNRVALMPNCADKIRLDKTGMMKWADAIKASETKSTLKYTRWGLSHMMVRHSVHKRHTPHMVTHNSHTQRCKWWNRQLGPISDGDILVRKTSKLIWLWEKNINHTKSNTTSHSTLNNTLRYTNISFFSNSWPFSVHVAPKTWTTGSHYVQSIYCGPPATRHFEKITGR